MSEEVKSESSRMIREKRWVMGKFRWQIGYGAFSCDHHSIDLVVQYINNQKTHHKKRSYLDEYRKALQDYQIDYEEKYLID